MYLLLYDAIHRHVSLPKPIAKHVPNELMTEEEWRSLGVKQSQGWEHYMIHSKCKYRTFVSGLVLFPCRSDSCKYMQVLNHMSCCSSVKRTIRQSKLENNVFACNERHSRKKKD